MKKNIMKYPNRISIIEFVHTMEHNPVVKKKDYNHSTKTWMNLENIILSENIAEQYDFMM